MESKIQNRNIANCCRTCLNDLSNKMFDLFTDENDSVNAAEMLKICISVKVSPDDKLPKKLCRTCYNCLVSFYAFKIQAKSIDQKLHQHFDKVQPGTTNKLNESMLEIKIETSESDFDNFDNLKQEYIEIETFSCSYCFTTFNDASEYDDHRKLHENNNFTTESPIKGEIQKAEHSKATKPSKILAKESQNIDNNSQECFKCEICSAKYTSINSLSAHKRKHITKGRVLSCTLCGKIFKKLSHLKRHELTHNTKKLYKCVLCAKSFKKEALLEEHLSIHSGGTAHQCPFCTKTFWHIGKLSNHVKQHTRGRQHLCAVCGKSFGSSGNLKQHLLRHGGEKRYDCTMCSKKFISKGELKNHQVSHSSEKSFSCDKCHAKFTRRCTLLKHNYRHLGIKPYKCDKCRMKFTTKSHLDRHYRVHTGERPYRCDICERTFTQSNDLVKHKRAHLGNEIYECHECSRRFRLKGELREHMSEHFISSKLREMRVNPGIGFAPTITISSDNIDKLTETNDGMLIEH